MFLKESFGLGAKAHHTRETNSIGHAKTQKDWGKKDGIPEATCRP
jgi:hypothetical protein